MKRVLVVMGVSGSGKSTVGEAVAGRLGAPFFDGDDFHPPENVAKMARGMPLDDDDRWPWLERLRLLLGEHLGRGETAVIACSALKKKYRDHLRHGNEGVVFVYLAGSFDLIWGRMTAREDHFMKPDMLRSQFAALEPPSSADTIIVNIEPSVAVIVDEIMQRLDGQNGR